MLFAVAATAGGGGQQSQKNDDEEDDGLDECTRKHAHGVIQLVYRCISIMMGGMRHHHALFIKR